MTQRYDTYKDSGVQWLGEIPGHWEVKPIRAILRENTDKTETGDEELLSLSQYTGISRKKDAAKIGMFEAESTVGYKKVHPGQFVMNIMLAWNGSYAVSEFEGIISPAYCVFDFISKDEKMYYNYLWRLSMYQGAFKTESRGIIDSRLRLYPNKFLPFPTICPPLSEQRSIVSFLDAKCGKIDEWVTKKQKEVEHLQELKQRVIADAVTRGLNPHVKMKATNIPWLKEIPEHWEALRAKHMFNKEQRPVEEGDEIVTCFRDGEVTLRKNRRTTGFTEATDFSHYQHICKGDLVIHQMDAFAGSAGVSDSDGMGTPVLSVCTPKSANVLNDYYAHIVRLMGKNGFILSLYRGIRERSSDFRFDTFANLWLPVPPISEQKQIVSYLDAKCSKIDKLIANITKEIERIKEYKQRLISDVVTGQIKVC